MKQLKNKALAFASTLAVAGFMASTPASAAVIELALLLDGSGSISSSDFALQIQGYQNVFTDPDFFSSVVAPSQFDTLAVAVWQFAGSTATPEISWMTITNQAEATAFGSLFAGITQNSGGTPMAAAIDAATSSILSNGIGGGADDRSVIDLSTDGSPNSESATTTAAQDAEMAGIGGLNALAVGPGADVPFLESIVFGPDGGFVETAETFEDFEDTLRTKVGREVNASVPEPGTLTGLLVVSVLGGSVLRKRKQKV